MKIIQPDVILLDDNIGNVAHVAKCARICYRKELGNDKARYISLEYDGHLSMFRHETYYYIIFKEDNDFDWLIDIMKRAIGFNFQYDENKTLYITINGQCYREYYQLIQDYLENYKVDKNRFAETERGFNMLRWTFKVITQISTSRELNRVSPNNISEQSTRYVYEDGTICQPHWLSQEIIDYINNNHINEITDTDIDNKCGKEYHFLKSCAKSFATYKLLVNEYKMDRQDARGILPLDTATVCAYTYSIEEWRHILDLRYYGTTGKPHPNAKIIASKIRDLLIEQGYDFR